MSLNHCGYSNQFGSLAELFCISWKLDLPAVWVISPAMFMFDDSPLCPQCGHSVCKARCGEYECPLLPLHGGAGGRYWRLTEMLRTRGAG